MQKAIESKNELHVVNDVIIHCLWLVRRSALVSCLPKNSSEIVLLGKLVHVEYQAQSSIR